MIKKYLIEGILIVSSLTVIMVAIKILRSIKKITQNGTEIEGIIFDMEQTGEIQDNISYPIVRFLTKEDLWITERNKIGVIPGMYEKGQKVIVIYQNGIPDNFIIKDQLTYLIPGIMICGGICLVFFAIWQLVNI